MTRIETVEIRTNPAGMVLFMSDWFQCDAFATKGYFRSEDGGPTTMGDTFFYLTDKGRAKSEAHGLTTDPMAAQASPSLTLSAGP